MKKLIFELDFEAEPAVNARRYKKRFVIFYNQHHNLKYEVVYDGCFINFANSLADAINVMIDFIGNNIDPDYLVIGLKALGV